MRANVTNNLNELPSGLASQLLSVEEEFFRKLQADPSFEDTYEDLGARVASMRAAQHSRAQMRGLAPLWKNSQEQIDDAVVRIGREGLVIADDRMNQFQVQMPNWLGIMELTSHKVGESRRANRGMVPGSRPDGGGLQNKTPYTVPIYVTWDEFGFNARELAAAARVGRPLDMDEVEQATRNVNYAVEDAIINGLDETINGNASNGLLDTTNTQAYESNDAWDDATKTGADILTDVLAMRDVLATDKFYGPYTLYVPTAYGAALQQPFDSSGITSLTRQAYLEQLQFGGRNLRIRTADLLPDDRTLLVQDTSSVVDVIVGQQPVAINPAPELEFHTKWLVYAVIVPRVKSDANSNFGVCAGNTS